LVRLMGTRVHDHLIEALIAVSGIVFIYDAFLGLWP
jgi:hypothetical protein